MYLTALYKDNELFGKNNNYIKHIGINYYGLAQITEIISETKSDITFKIKFGCKGRAKKCTIPKNKISLGKLYTNAIYNVTYDSWCGITFIDNIIYNEHIKNQTEWNNLVKKYKDAGGELKN